MPRQEVTVTIIKQYKYPKAVFPSSKVNDNEAKRLALTDLANDLNVNVGEDFFDAYMVNDGTYAIKNSSLTLKGNHISAIANIMAKEDIEAKHGPLDPTTNPKLYKFDGEGNPYLKNSIDDELHHTRHIYEDRLNRALFIDAGLEPRSNRRQARSVLEELIRRNRSIITDNSENITSNSNLTNPIPHSTRLETDINEEDIEDNDFEEDEF